jgi:hypothetical protein
MGTICETPIRELDHRSEDGIDVTLLWDNRTNRVFLRVVDSRLYESLEFDVIAGDALYAFRHPYAYASLDRSDRALAA